MAEASASGAFAFDRFDPREPKHWAGLRLVLGRVAARAAAPPLALHHAAWAAQLAHPGIDRAGRDALAGHAADCARGVAALLAPWAAAAVAAAADPAAARRDLADRWEAAFGRLDDPATVARIDATVRLLESRRLARA